MTRDEYVNSVHQIIRNNERAVSGIPAAQLGTLIVRALTVHWTAVGYPALKSLLMDLESKNLVRVGPNAKGALSVWLADASPAVNAAPPKQPFLRKEVWNAFVSSRPLGRRFMERTQGLIRMGIDEPPTPPELWVEIKRVGDDQQKAWCREFLASHDLTDGDLRESLGDPLWFHKVPLALRAVNPDYVKQWNWRRSEKVTQLVFAWCDSEGVARSLVMATQEAPMAPSAASVQVVAAATQSHREQVLAALARMTTDELLALPIPAKYLLVAGLPR